MSTTLREDFEARDLNADLHARDWRLYIQTNERPTPHRDHVYRISNKEGHFYYRGSIFKVDGLYRLSSYDGVYNHRYVISSWESLEGAMAAYLIAASTGQFGV